MTRMKWWIFATLLRNTAASVVPIALQKSYLVVYRPMMLLDVLAVPNYLGAFVYLVDKNGGIRWSASGTATDEELETMHRLVRQLSHEQQ